MRELDNQYDFGGAPLDQARLTRGEPLSVQYAALDTNKSGLAMVWVRLLTMPFVCARGSILFVTLNYCGTCVPSVGPAVACQTRLQVAIDATSAINTAPQVIGDGNWSGETLLVEYLSAHSSNNNDEQQIEALFVLQSLEPGRHVLTVEGRGVDGVTALSGRFDCNAASNPWVHGCSIMIEEFSL